MDLPLSRLSLIAATLATISLPSHAEEFQNRPFSVFGAFGLEYVSYSEHLKDFAGQEVDSTFTSTNLVQRSGGYTAATDTLGFFINTGSTLISNEADETWEAEGISGNIQEDVAAMNYQTLDVMLAYHLQNGFYLLGGVHYQKIAFSRFGWRSAAGTDEFADAVESYTLNNQELLDAMDAIIQKGEKKDKDGNIITTREQYLAENRFDPEETLDVVFEDAVSFGLMTGIGYDSYFVRPTKGIRYMWEVGLGTQVYENILNSNGGRSLTRTFGGGIDIAGKAGIGYHFSHRLGLMLGMDAHYSLRKELQESSTVSLPENEFYSLASYASVTWNFK